MNDSMGILGIVLFFATVGATFFIVKFLTERKFIKEIKAIQSKLPDDNKTKGDKKDGNTGADQPGIRSERYSAEGDIGRNPEPKRSRLLPPELTQPDPTPQPDISGDEQESGWDWNTIKQNR